MGMLDSLGNLGGLGSITKMFDVGNIVKGVVDKVLPENLHFVGDVAGAFVDFKSGNLIGAAQLAMQAIKDLPQAQAAQATKGQQNAQPQGAAANQAGAAPATVKPELEPSPPPLSSRDGRPFDWNELLSAVKALTAALTGQSAKTTAEAKTNAKTDAKTDAKTTKTDAPAAPETTSTKTAEGSAAGATATASSSRTREATQEWLSQAGGWRKGPPPTRPAPSSDATPGSAAKPDPKPDPKPATKPDTKADAAATAGAADKGQTISSLSQLQGMSDAAIRDAVINGRISPDFAKDQAGMMALQQRMNAITEMNNLMTAMMRALHDMQMAVVQNIRI
jgi:hypothetical protein